MRISSLVVAFVPLFAITASAQTRPASDSVAPSAPIAVADITFEAGESWRVEEPGSAMRKAQIAIPGDGGDASLIVFHFGRGQGGGVDANIMRWLGQLQAPGGGEVKDAETATREVNGLPVTIVRAKGTYASGMPGGEKTPVTGSALVGIIVESPEGPVFIKITGPAKTVTSTATGEAIDAMIASLRRAP